MNPVETFDPGCGFLSSAEIDDALNGQLPRARIAEFDGHVEDGCSECVTLAADLNLFRDVTAGEPLEIERREDDARAKIFRERLRKEVRRAHAGVARGLDAPAVRGWAFGWSWALGAVATLLVVAGAWFALRDPGLAPGSLSIPLPGGASYVAQVKEFSVAPVLRGQPDLHSLWREAGAAYGAGDFDAAEHHLASIIERSADSLDALIYRGISLLALGKNTEAREILATARVVALEQDDSTSNLAWFEGLAALAGGELVAGRSFLREAAAGTGANAELARDLLQQLQ